MSNVFSNLVDICIVIYLDDILVYFVDKTEYTHQIRGPLQTLQNGLYARADKCEFYSDTIEYLSYLLLPEGLIMLFNKVCTIIDWPELCQVKDIQSFLSFCNFYYCFIKNYSNIVILLRHLTCKNALWNFSDLYKQTFAALKKAFIFTLVFAHWVLDA